MIRLQVSVGGGKLMIARSRLRQVFRSAGNEVKAVAQRLVSGQGSGRIYYGIGSRNTSWRPYQRIRWQASAPGEPPARVLGRLRESIRVMPYKSGGGVAIRATEFYAFFLEHGAEHGRQTPRSASGARRWRKRRLVSSRVLLPRPFLTRALAERAPSIGPRITRAVREDMKFVRVPARKAA
jgi:hypothetical protein